VLDNRCTKSHAFTRISLEGHQVFGLQMHVQVLISGDDCNTRGAG
jgi:hypothetical protein